MKKNYVNIKKILKMENDNKTQKNVTLIEYRESIFTKIINKIKRAFFNK